MRHKERTASCSCGQLRFMVVGEPALTWICHCTNCQRRTGSTHGATTWFLHDQIKGRSGEFKVFERAPGQGAQSEFCGDCGTTVSWVNPSMPHAKGFATGCFGDPELPPPKLEFFTRSRHRWLEPVEGAAQFDTQLERPSEEKEPG